MSPEQSVRGQDSMRDNRLIMFGPALDSRLHGLVVMFFLVLDKPIKEFIEFHLAEFLVFETWPRRLDFIRPVVNA
jgi:hypothetical protein